MSALKRIVLILLPLFIQMTAFSQEVRRMESLNYSYMGPVVSASYSSAEYSDWADDQYGKETVSGPSYGAGMVLNIFAGPLCGDFQLKYIYNSFDTTLTFMEISMFGKYLWKINSIFSAGSGLGIYLESPPASESYDGSAGIQIPLSAYFTLSSNSKVFTDIYARYGSFGMGEDGNKISYGINMGFLYKVGRI